MKLGLYSSDICDIQMYRNIQFGIKTLGQIQLKAARGTKIRPDI